MTFTKAILSCLVILFTVVLPVSAEDIVNVIQKGSISDITWQMALNDSKESPMKSPRRASSRWDNTKHTTKVNNEPLFEIDPKAAIKFKQLHDSRVLDAEAMAEQTIANLRSSGTKHIAAILSVVITENHQFFTSPSYGTIMNRPPGILFITRADADKVILATPKEELTAKLYDLHCTDTDICAAIEAMRKSNLPNPSVLVISAEMIKDEKKANIFNSTITLVINRILIALEKRGGFDHREGRVTIPNRAPNYLFGKSTSMYDLIKSFSQPEVGSLPALVVRGVKSESRDYYDRDGNPRLYIHTRTSAPIELDLDDLAKVTSVSDEVKHGIFERTLAMQHDLKITFGGLSALNADFLKSANNGWKSVVGLSSPSGLTISVKYKDGKKLTWISGEDIRKNNSNIQAKLPKNVVKMYTMVVPGEALLSDLLDRNCDVRTKAVSALDAIRDIRDVDALMSALKESDKVVLAAVTLGSIGTDAIISALRDDSSEVREAAASSLGTIAVYASKYGAWFDCAESKQLAAMAVTNVKDGRVVDALISALRDQNVKVQEEAASSLGYIGDSRAVDALISVLRDDSAKGRKAAAVALGYIKDGRAIDALKSALRDQNPEVQKNAAWALMSIMGQKHGLEALLTEQNLELIANRHEDFISAGILGSEPLLIKALERYGSPSMAEHFVNSNNKLLEGAGASWAVKHGYRVESQRQFGSKLLWGLGWR